MTQVCLWTELSRTAHPVPCVVGWGCVLPGLIRSCVWPVGTMAGANVRTPSKSLVTGLQGPPWSAPPWSLRSSGPLGRGLRPPLDGGGSWGKEGLLCGTLLLRPSGPTLTGLAPGYRNPEAFPKRLGHHRPLQVRQQPFRPGPPAVLIPRPETASLFSPLFEAPETGPSLSSDKKNRKQVS